MSSRKKPCVKIPSVALGLTICNMRVNVFETLPDRGTRKEGEPKLRASIRLADNITLVRNNLREFEQTDTGKAGTSTPADFKASLLLLPATVRQLFLPVRRRLKKNRKKSGKSYEEGKPINEGCQVRCYFPKLYDVWINTPDRLSSSFSVSVWNPDFRAPASCL